MPARLSKLWSSDWRWIWAFLPGLLIGLTINHLRLSRQDSPSLKGPPAAKKTAQTVRLVPGSELKVVLVVNGSLKMGKGKIAAQCAHAAVGLYQDFRKSNKQLFELWEHSSGQKKIALNCPTDEELTRIRRAAKESGCLHFLVQDAGRTQIAAGSSTVLAIGPATDADLAFTRHLKLL